MGTKVASWASSQEGRRGRETGVDAYSEVASNCRRNVAMHSILDISQVHKRIRLWKTYLSRPERCDVPSPSPKYVGSSRVTGLAVVLRGLVKVDLRVARLGLPFRKFGQDPRSRLSQRNPLRPPLSSVRLLCAVKLARLCKNERPPWLTLMLSRSALPPL
jgi:hypothetical protein